MDSRLVFRGNRMIFIQGSKWKQVEGLDLEMNLQRFCSSDSSLAHQTGRRDAHRDEHLSTHGCFFAFCRARLSWAHPLPADTFSVTTITDGYAREQFPWLLRCPDCILSRLLLLELRPTGDPVDSDSSWRRSSSKIERSLPFAKVLSVSPHSGVDGLVQGELPPFFFPPWMLTVFTSLACYPLLPRLTADSWAGIGEDCRRRITIRPFTVADSSNLPLLRLTGGFCHADWTVPRQDVNSFFAPACVTPAGPSSPGSHVLTIAFHTVSSNQTRYLEYFADR